MWKYALHKKKHKKNKLVAYTYINIIMTVLFVGYNNISATLSKLNESEKTYWHKANTSIVRWSQQCYIICVFYLAEHKASN